MDKLQTPEEFGKEIADELWIYGSKQSYDRHAIPIVTEKIKQDRAAVRAPLVEAGEAIVKEWDILPSELPLRIEDIIEWLQRYLGPQVEALRAALEAARGGVDEK